MCLTLINHTLLAYDLPIIPQEYMQLSAVVNIKVKQFKFDGNHVFSANELARVTQPYLNINLSPEQLQQVKNEITHYYINKGYVNSGAIIPDQQITDGIVTIKIIEGTLAQVEVTGNDSIRSAYIENCLLSTRGATLNINKLQERLQMLHQNPLFKRLDAELTPGVKLGKSILKINVYEARPYQLQFNFDNHRSPSVGSYRGEVEGWYRNFTGLFGKGWGDTVHFRYGLTKGLNDYSLGYSFPFNPYDTTLSFDIERSDSEVVDSPFNQLNIESEADSYAITLSHSLQRFKELSQSLDLAIKLEKRSSKSFLLSQPFSFSPGVINGESELSVIRFSQDWVKRSRIHVLAARSTLNFGLDALDSTVNEDGSPDSNFFSWLGQFQYVRRLNFLESPFMNRSKILFRTDFLWANQGLLPLEKLSIGGVSTVRGYRENLITRDNGLIYSLQWHIPVIPVPISKFKRIPEDGLLELMFFVDYGRAWNAERGTLDSEEIYSVGLGLHWNPYQHLRTQFYWGYPLRDFPEPEDRDLQDDGVHFKMSLLF